MQWKCIYDQSRESGDEGGVSCNDSQIEMDGGHEFQAKDIVKRNNNAITVKAELWRSNIVPPSVVTAAVNTNLLPSQQASAAATSRQSDRTKDEFLEDGSVTTTPPYDVVLNHVYGIKIADCRQTIKYNEQGHMVYMVGTYGIICDRDNECKQRIYQQHKHVLISMDVNVTGKLVATGELSLDPELHIWNATTACGVSVIKGIHRRGITSICFTSCNHYLITLGQDLRNSVVVLCSPSGLWNDVYTVCSSGLTTQKMLWCTALENSSNEFPYVVGGNRCIYFFRISGKSIERCKGVVGKKRKIQPIMCAVKGHPIATMVNLEGSSSSTVSIKDKKKKKEESSRTDINNSSDILGGKNKSFAIDTPATGLTTLASGVLDVADPEGGSTIPVANYAPACLLLTGTVTGHIYVWVNNRVHLSIVAHNMSVNAIVTTDQGYISACKEGFIKIWNLTLNAVHQYNSQIGFVPRPLDQPVHAIAVNLKFNKLTIGKFI